MENSTGKVFLIAFFSRILVILASFLFLKISRDLSFISFLTAFANRWDGPHYLFIAQHGYVATGIERLFIVFPPFYPFLIRIFNIFLGNFAITAILLSNIFFILGSILFYKLLRLDYPEDFSLWVIIFLSLFPTAYFFSTAYAESLFLFLLSATLLLIRNNQFYGGAILAAFLTLTKPFGVIIWPAIIFEWFSGKKRSWITFLTILLMMVAAIEIYLALNYLLFAEPFAFQKFLRENWFKSFAPPWEGIRGLWGRIIVPIDSAEFFVTISAWILTFFGFTKWANLRFSYAIYNLLGVLFFSSTGFILSSPRYLLSLPFLFVLFSQIIKQKLLRLIWLIFSIPCLFYLSSIFAKGGWAF